MTFNFSGWLGIWRMLPSGFKYVTRTLRDFASRCGAGTYASFRLANWFFANDSTASGARLYCPSASRTAPTNARKEMWLYASRKGICNSSAICFAEADFCASRPMIRRRSTSDMALTKSSISGLSFIFTFVNLFRQTSNCIITPSLRESRAGKRVRRPRPLEVGKEAGNRRGVVRNPSCIIRAQDDPITGGVLVDQPQFAYFEGKIVPFGEAKVSVATHAFNYGTGVFGGLRGYWNEERKRLFVFRPWDHFHRLLHSARLLCMEVSHTEESLIQIMLDLLRAENWQRDVYLRPMFYKADAGIGVRLHNLKDDLTMWSVPFQKYIQNDTSAHATISSWRRIDDNVIPARGKISGAYVNSALAKTDAARAGFDEALTLDQNGHVSEGSAMNVFMVRDGTVITPPVTENILEGITRRSFRDDHLRRAFHGRHRRAGGGDHQSGPPPGRQWRDGTGGVQTPRYVRGDRARTK
ncbi:MAG: hypothetical protein DCC54_11360 [Anaerolineae bacterium]|nr:MAG: hypothetical protein DCC54_11360 [Anaerolineae bacterium]